MGRYEKAPASEDESFCKLWSPFDCVELWCTYRQWKGGQFYWL